jgi:gliding motility-associated-like protein
VNVSQVTTLNIFISALPDTCGNHNGSAAAIVTGGTPGYLYNWNPSGQITQTATGLATGVYTVTITDTNGCAQFQTVNVTQIPGPTATITSLPDTCGNSNGSAIVNATGGTPGYSYQWNPSGQTAATATGLSPGIYTVTVTDTFGCTQVQTVNVTQIPGPTVIVSSSPDTCGKNNGSAAVTVSGGTPGYSYYWNPTGQTGQTATGLAPGTYTVTVTDTNGCLQVQSALIGMINQINAAITASSTSIAAGEYIQINVTGGDTYLWSPASGLSCATCPDPIVSLDQTTEFCVKIEEGTVCADSLCITITVAEPCTQLYVPNVFSPNDDGENDVLYLRGSCIKTMEFFIYDRWGERMFSTTDVKTGWDGKYKGEPLDQAVFVWYLKATLESGQEIRRKGNITLLR